MRAPGSARAWSPRRPRLWSLVAMAVAGLVCTFACDERERTNPLDPLNDETGGVPDWLEAIAENAAVSLVWRASPPQGFAAYELFRRTETDSSMLVARIEDPGRVALTDSSVVNATGYTYRLDILVGHDTRVELPEKTATPGSAVPWVLESGAFGLLRFTPDGRRVRVRTGSGSGHFDVVSSPDGLSVWAADYFASQVQRFDHAGRFLSLVNVRLPFRIAVDAEREILWVASWALGSDPVLHALAYDGDELARFTLREEVRDLVVDESTGACYAALGRGGGIARAAVGDTLRSSAATPAIMMLALVPGGRVFGGDPLDGGVFGFDLEDLSLEATAPFMASPQAMTFGLECLWVADGSDRIICLDRNLMVHRELVGVGLVSGIAADDEMGVLWLALPNAGRVMRIRATGEVVSSVALFQPFGISIGRADTVARRAMP